MASFTKLLQEKLPPVHPIRGVASPGDGSSGTVSLSFGTEFKPGLEIEVVTTRGAVTWSPSEVKVLRASESGERKTATKEIKPDQGVEAEIEAFGKAVATGTLDPRQSPGEALKDLWVLEALLKSGEAGGAVQLVG